MPPTPPSHDDALDLDALDLKSDEGKKADASESDFEKELEALFEEELASSDEKPASTPPKAAPEAGQDAPEEDVLQLDDLVTEPAATASAVPTVTSDDAMADSTGAADEDILDLGAFDTGGELDLAPPEGGGTDDGAIDLSGLDEIISGFGETKAAPAASAAPASPASAAPTPEAVSPAPSQDADEEPLDLGLDDLLEEPQAAAEPEPVAASVPHDSVDFGGLLEDLDVSAAPASPASAAPTPEAVSPAPSQDADEEPLDLGLDDLLEEPQAAAEPEPVAASVPHDSVDFGGLLEDLDVSAAPASPASAAPTPEAVSPAPSQDADEEPLDLSLADLLEEPQAAAPETQPAATSAAAEDILDLTLPDFSEPEPGRDLVAEQEQADMGGELNLSLDDAAPAPPVTEDAVDRLLGGDLDMGGLMEGIEPAAGGEPQGETALDAQALLDQIPEAEPAPEAVVEVEPTSEPKAEPELVAEAEPAPEPVAEPSVAVESLAAAPEPEARPVAESGFDVASMAEPESVAEAVPTIEPEPALAESAMGSEPLLASESEPVVEAPDMPDLLESFDAGDNVAVPAEPSVEPVSEPVSAQEPVSGPAPRLADAALAGAVAGALATGAFAAMTAPAATTEAEPIELTEQAEQTELAETPKETEPAKPAVSIEEFGELRERLELLATQLTGNSVAVVRLEGKLAERETTLAEIQERLRASEAEAERLRGELSALRGHMEESLTAQNESVRQELALATQASADKSQAAMDKALGAVDKALAALDRAQAATDRVDSLTPRVESAEMTVRGVGARLTQIENRQGQQDREITAEIARSVPREAAKVIREEIANLAATMRDE